MTAKLKVGDSAEWVNKSKRSTGILRGTVSHIVPAGQPLPLMVSAAWMGSTPGRALRHDRPACTIVDLYMGRTKQPIGTTAVKIWCGKEWTIQYIYGAPGDECFDREADREFVAHVTSHSDCGHDVATEEDLAAFWVNSDMP